MLPTCSAPSGTSPAALSGASSTATSSPTSSPRKSEMTLFQNSQRLMSAEGVSTTKSGNVVYRLRFEDGRVYLTEPDDQVGSAAPTSSEARRVGTEWDSRRTAQWAQYH